MNAECPCDVCKEKVGERPQLSDKVGRFFIWVFAWHILLALYLVELTEKRKKRRRNKK